LGIARSREKRRHLNPGAVVIQVQITQLLLSEIHKWILPQDSFAPFFWWRSTAVFLAPLKRYSLRLPGLAC
jgi:hypothetical protein